MTKPRTCSMCGEMVTPHICTTPPKSDNPSPSEGLKRFAADNQLHPTDELKRVLSHVMRAAKAHYSGQKPVSSPGDVKMTDTLPSLIHAHMKAMLQDVIGDEWYCEYELRPDTYDSCKWCGDPRYKHTGMLQRQRAAKWLPKEDTNHER